jgi:hypothetical protein
VSDPRLADAFGRPIRGLPWWEHEIHPDFWIALHTGWVIFRPLFQDRIDALAFVIAREEFFFADYRLDAAAFGRDKKLDWLTPKQTFLGVKVVCQNLACGAVKMGA